MYIDNKYNDIVILGGGPTQELDGTILPAEVKYPINFTQSGKTFVLILHYNESNSFLFVNATKICQLKAKDFEIKDYTLRLGNNSTKIFQMYFLLLLVQVLLVIFKAFV